MDTSPINKVKSLQDAASAHELDRLVVDHVLLVLAEVENIFEERRIGEHAALHIFKTILDEAEGPFFFPDACARVSRRDRQQTTPDLLSRRRLMPMKGRRAATPRPHPS